MALQMSTALLDLVGVALVGVLSILSASLITGAQIPSRLQEALQSLGFTVPGGTTTIVVVSLLSAGFLLAKTATYGVLARSVYRVLGRSQASATAALADKLLRQPLSRQEVRRSQEVTFALTSGASAAFIGVLSSAAIVASEATLLLVLGLALMVVDPLVTTVVVIYLALVGLVVHRSLARWSGRLGQRLRVSAVQSHQSLQEALDSGREIRVTKRSRLFSHSLSRQLRVYANSLSDSYFASQVPKLAYESALVIGGILLTGWQFATADAISAITTLAVFLVAASRVIPSMLRISVQLNLIAGSAAQAHSTYDLASSMRGSPDDPVNPLGGGPPGHQLREAISSGYPGFAGRISMEGVSFTYVNADGPTLHGISLTIAAGQTLALVGPTGSGKSTLVDVMLGLRAPDSGLVTIDGLGPDVAIDRWPGAIGYVPQAVHLANGSIRENVAFGFSPEDVDDALVWQALSHAHLDDFIRGQIDGLNALVGERGLKLSGGQRQRLGVARALYSRPRLLVLDEATSSLDAETESALASTMHRLAGQTTIVTIAHRLATIRDADQVAYVDRGSIRATGTFDEVRSAIPDFDRQALLLGLRRNGK